MSGMILIPRNMILNHLKIVQKLINDIDEVENNRADKAKALDYVKQLILNYKYKKEYDYEKDHRRVKKLEEALDMAQKEILKNYYEEVEKKT